MDIQAEKIALMKLLLETESEDIIGQLKQVFKKQDNDFYDELPESVKYSLAQGIADVEQGNVRDHELVMHDVKAKYGLKH